MQEHRDAGHPSKDENRDHSAHANSGTGLPQGEQGQASFSTGSTTQGGSNHGQGSSHLGGESYQQGASSGAGASYTNETDRLGSSTVGTPDEGAQSPRGGQASGIGETATRTGTPAEDERTFRENVSSDGVDAEDTSLDQSMNLDESRSDTKGAERQSGSWSQSSIDQ